MNEYEVLDTSETFSSLTSDIASAFSDYIKYREFENDVLSWVANQSQPENVGLEIENPNFEDLISEIKPPLSPRQESLKKLLIQAFAEHITNQICILTKENCEGCKIDHPSQRRYDCMILDNKAMTSWYLTEARERVNEEEAMKTFLAYTNEHSPLNGTIAI